MTSSNEKIEPGFYWVRFPGDTDDTWTIGEVTDDPIELSVVGWDASVRLDGAVFGPRIDPPEPPGVDYYVTATDADTFTLGTAPPPAPRPSPAPDHGLVTGDGPISGPAAALFPPAADLPPICRGCGRNDCQAPAARAAYDVAKARLDKEQADKCNRIGDWSRALPLIPVQERYALEDAERDCKAAHAAAWDRYLAERTASPPAMPERLEARMSDEDTEAELGRYAAPGRPALIDHGAVAYHAIVFDDLDAAIAAGRALVAWAEQQKASGR